MSFRSVTMARTHQRGRQLPVLYDRWLLFAIFCLFALGLLMVASSSIVLSYRLYDVPFYFFVKQAVYLAIGLLLGLVVTRIQLDVWRRNSGFLLLFSASLLILVLVPGIGREVNGSMRWLGVGPIGVQVSEVAKLSLIIYLAGYLVRHGQEVRTRTSGFAKPMLILIIITGLLLKEPDFGASVVIMCVALGMLFLAGVRLWQFLSLFALVIAVLAVIAFSSPYRLARLTSFLNPWEHAFQSGYQLTQSLIAFGRGGWFGVGLGESVQKLFYLPEAHTDFIFAVLGEELGLLGCGLVIALFSLLVYRAVRIGRQNYQLGNYFSAYVAYGIGLWIGLQALINMGVSIGVLPTKGLTLPLISYGGSSLLVFCVTLAILVRIDHESRLMTYGLHKLRR
jgi:cell division protein FtsW